MTPGQRVRDRHYGYEGVIVACHDDFSVCAARCLTMTGEQWLARQQVPVTPAEQREPWYTVAVDGGGAVWAPESQLEVLPASP